MARRGRAQAREDRQRLAALEALPTLADAGHDAEGLARLARSAPARAETGRFVVEGLRALERLIDPATAGGHVCELLVIDPDGLGRRGRELIERGLALIERADVPKVRCSREAFRQLAQTSKPRGLLAIARAPRPSPAELLAALADDGLAVAAIGLADPGNLGTLMRSAAAFGCGALFACEGSADPLHPKVLRASAGHLLPVWRGAWAELDAAARELSVERIGLEARDGAAELGAASPPAGRRLLLLGGEAGYPADVAADRWLQIPMAPGCDSLNAGVAGSLALWTLTR